LIAPVPQVIHGYSQQEIADHLGISVAGPVRACSAPREKMQEMLA
jgi:DNA-directed RNA polymerase specialized sigma24 family protein